MNHFSRTARKSKSKVRSSLPHIPKILVEITLMKRKHRKRNKLVKEINSTSHR